MEKLLYKIYNNTYPKFTSYKFGSMINIGLVITGYKKGALEKIDEKLKKHLTNIGLYVDYYPLIKTLTFISKRNPLFTDNTSHKDVGKNLGFLTPIELDDKIKGKSYFIGLIIKFTNNGNKPLIANIVSQVVVNKSEKDINEYLDKIIIGIRKLPIPKQFKIIQITKEIQLKDT